MTTGPRGTRRSSRTPASRSSSQWWMVRIAIAASTLPSRSGSAPAVARMAGGSSGGRCAAITSLGSIGDHVAVARLVGAGAGPDVDDGARVPQRGVDPLGDPRVLTTQPGVAVADAFIARSQLGHRGADYTEESSV